MAKNLQVTTDRSPDRQISLDATLGRLFSLTVAAGETLIHTVPEGYKDEVSLFGNAITTGKLRTEFDGDATTFLISTLSANFVAKVIDAVPIEARTGDVPITCQAITNTAVIWGFVVREPL